MHRDSFLILDHVVSAVEQRVWNGKSFSFRLRHICKPASCARRNIDRPCRLGRRDFILGSVRHGDKSNCRLGEGFRR
jgi:hypothetical protein